MRIAIGSDHAGFALKSDFVRVLAAQGHDVVDLGTDSEAMVDYPAYCAAVAREVASGAVERGIVLGGSGQGEQIVAKWLPLVWEAFTDYRQQSMHLTRIEIDVVSALASESAERATAVAEPLSGRERRELEDKLTQLGFTIPWPRK